MLYWLVGGRKAHRSDRTGVTEPVKLLGWGQMFGWIGKLVDRIAEGMVRRGQSIVQGDDRAMEERRAAVRSVRDTITEAMTHAGNDREHGRDDERSAAVAAANRVGAVVHELADDDARRLVLEWRSRFDAIQKGWKEGGHANLYDDERLPRGYPEPAWTELRQSADAALARLGVVLRELLERHK